MKIGETMEIIKGYENDFDEISSIINSDLTPSEKVSQIADIVEGGEEEDDDGEGEEGED